MRDADAFWSSQWEFFEVQAHAPYTAVLADERMPGARWFPGARLNYAEHALRRRDDAPALLFASETRSLERLSRRELYGQVAAVAASLRALGVGPGDRVASFMPNIPQTAVAFLATASIGAIWSSCSPEFGVPSVVDRFRQIEPRVLFAADGYEYRGKPYGRIEAVRELREALPTLETTVAVPYLEEYARFGRLRPVVPWADLLASSADEIAFEAVPFDQPLWVLYSSGTTGLPKAIVHGHGGMLLEHLRLALHMDLRAGDSLFWYSTTGWMVWNILISGLLLEASVVLYDGSPFHPDARTLWRLAEQAGVTHLGCGAPVLEGCMREGVEPGADFDLAALRMVASTAAPLSPEGFSWVYGHVKGDLHLGSISGGTDICGALAAPCPLLPVHAGEIQCRPLGCLVECFDEEGRSVVDEVGELVVTRPLPSMPLFLWNDEGGRRYQESYFEAYPGVWRHGDLIKITPRGSVVIYGRSDSTLKRGGIRVGTSELYRIVDELPEVADSIAVDTSGSSRIPRLLLFVVPAEGRELDTELQRRIVGAIRDGLSPRHVPDEIHAIAAVPRTLNGKKLEVPVKRILTGTRLDDAVNVDAVANPGSLEIFVALAKSRNA